MIYAFHARFQNVRIFLKCLFLNDSLSVKASVIRGMWRSGAVGAFTRCMILEIEGWWVYTCTLKTRNNLKVPTMALYGLHVSMHAHTRRV